MSRIDELFERKQGRILNVYCTAGYPSVDSTMEVIRALEKHGADMVELGMPYSDPLADGPVIQASNMVALHNGMTMEKLFEQLRDLRKEVSLPVILMGYMNPVLQFGFEKFCAAASAAGIDGLILPDLPPYEFEQEYRPITRRYGLDFIFLITPETAEERVRELDRLSSGFLYAVSASSTTGNTRESPDIADYLKRLQSMNLAHPVLVGFGIRDKEGFEHVCRYARGAIIGSAYIRALGDRQDLDLATRQFLSGILPAGE